MAAFDPAAIAAEVVSALDDKRQLAPFEELDAGRAYAVAAELRALRKARGETPVGRKIGFTNRNIWAEYGVYEPIWGDVYDTTVRDVVPGDAICVSHLSEPRIEPEIVCRLRRDIRAGMALADIADAVEWVAHGFEIVQSIYPGWRFGVADCIADGGLHGALFLGPRHAVTDEERADLAGALAGLTLRLSRDGETVDTGTGANALDGPLQAIGHLADLLERDPHNPPLREGEIISTGTLTRAFPVEPGQQWATEIDRFPLPGLSVRIA